MVPAVTNSGRATVRGWHVASERHLGWYRKFKPTLLTNVDGKLYFVANDGLAGEELWKSDGTAAGTQLVANTSGDGGSNPTQIAFNGNKVFYAASTDTFGKELHAEPGPPRLAAPIQIGNGTVQRPELIS